MLSLFCANGFATNGGQTKWRLKNRLQTSYEFDDNIREDPGAPDSLVSDNSLRLLFQSSASLNHPKTQVRFNYKGGFQSYFENKVENKLVHDVDGSLAWRFGNFVLGARFEARLKLYLNRDLDYSSGSVQSFFQFPGFARMSNEIAVGRSGIDYQNSTDFDNSDTNLSWQISRNLSKSVSCRVAPGLSIRRYDQRLAFVVSGTNGNIQVALPEKQKDTSMMFLAHLGYSGRFFFRLSYHFQSNRSNSDIFDYSRHQVSLALGTPLPAEFLLRFYAAAQFKHYSINNARQPVSADPERNESNFAILDLSRDFRTQLTALLRFAYYNNESVIRERFYRKKLVTFGLDFRF